MSILIKGMQMPTCCRKCKLIGEYGCAIVGAVGTAYTDGKRSRDCPLIELPPHGRLIDADALTFEDDYYGWRDKKVVKSAPTIIESEGEE